MKMPTREWFMRKIKLEGDADITIGGGEFRDASVFVDVLRDAVKPAHDPETQKNDPNIYRYEDDK